MWICKSASCGRDKEGVGLLEKGLHEVNRIALSESHR